MKPTTTLFAAALVAAPAFAFAASTPPAAKSGPPTIPYVCDGGRPASVVYESGSDYQHARALVTFEGETLEMRSAPTLYGVRYRAEVGGEGAPLAWSLRGEYAWLTEAPTDDSYTRREREVARCHRLRGIAAAEATHEGHGDDH